MTSAYVLFELGARWGAGKHLCPVLARGADDTFLGGPLGGKNALHLTSRAEVVQMVEEVASILGRNVDSWTSVQNDIDKVVRLASNVAEAERLPKASASAAPAIDETELNILRLLAAAGDSRPTAAEIGRELRLHTEKARYHVQRLEYAGLIDSVENWGYARKVLFPRAGGSRDPNRTRSVVKVSGFVGLTSADSAAARPRGRAAERRAACRN